MNEFVQSLKEWVREDHLLALGKAVLILLFGILVARMLSRWLKISKLHAQHSMILRRVISVAVVILAILLSLRQLGVDMGVLLGAAGILTVAVGFAAQTSASNLISGIFLMGEKPFQIGDLIKVGETTGFVLTIDFMSVKIRTFDNLLVRIPNETMLKSEVTNLTRFPIRRVDLQIGVAYKENLERVRAMLMAIAEKNPHCLDYPKPLFLFKKYGNSALEFQFSVWAAQADVYQLKTDLYMEVKKSFDENGIEIPFPHVSVYAGAASEPIPVRVIGSQEQHVRSFKPPLGELK